MYRRNKKNHLKLLVPGFALIIIGSSILGYINKPKSADYQEWHTTGKGYPFDIPANVNLPAPPPGALANTTPSKPTNEDPVQPPEEPIQTATADPTLPAIPAETQQPTQTMALDTHPTPKEPIDRNSLRLSELNTAHPPRNNETQNSDLLEGDVLEGDPREGEALAEPQPTPPINRDSLRLSNLQIPSAAPIDMIDQTEEPPPPTQFQTTTPNSKPPPPIPTSPPTSRGIVFHNPETSGVNNLTG